MKKILKFLFPKTIEELQEEAVEEYYTRENDRHLEWAKANIPYYLYGKKNKDGLQEGYKFVPTKLGLVELVIKKTSSMGNKNNWMI